MTKEQFVKRMGLIQRFHNQQKDLGKLIEKIADDTYIIVSFGDELIDEMIEMITEELNIDDKDLLSWWLYEDVEKIIYYGNNQYNVEQLEDFYDCIIHVYKDSCDNCGHSNCYTRINNPNEKHTCPPCTGWKAKED